MKKTNCRVDRIGRLSSMIGKKTGRLFGFLLTSFSFLLAFSMEFSTGCIDTLESNDTLARPYDDATIKKRPHPAIGNYTVYYGGFHNHSGVSDGTGTPEEAYRYAKYRAGLDFFGLTDHDFSRTDANWSEVIAMANLYDADSIFAAFWGFEWTSSTYGHLTVVNTDDFTMSSNPLTQTFQQLCSWLSIRNCFAILNHPGYLYSGDPEFDHFLSPVCEKIVGMELWNKSVPFSFFYYTDGYDSNDNDKGFYDEALSRGWKIGAAGGFDDHTATWGTAVDFRIAVLAKNLTRQDIFNAMKARRFYSTLDKNIALSFTIDGREMGSTIPGGMKNIEIQASDGNGEIFSEVVLFDRNHDRRRTWNPNDAAVDITDTLTVGGGDYYYVKITQQDSGEAISSPIWVSDPTTDTALPPIDPPPKN